MAFIETPRFPDEIAYGATGGSMYSTSVITSLTGDEQRNQNWLYTRMRYQIGLVNRGDSTTRTLIAFFNSIAKGRLNGFRFKDHNPGESTITDAQIGTGDGSTTTFQLVKRYPLGSYEYFRTITKPVNGTVTCKLNGTPTAAFTVNTGTGVITFTSAPALGVAITASCDFDVPVRFDTDVLEIQRVDGQAYSWPSIVLVEVRDVT